MHIRQFSALLATAAILAGIPYAAAVVLSWPDLSHLSWITIQVHLQGGQLPPGVANAALIVVLWAAWALYVLALAVEILQRLRGARWRRRPLGPAQALAALALGSVLLAGQAAHAAPTPANAAAAEAAADPEPATPPGTAAAPGGEPSAECPSPPGAAAEAERVDREAVIDDFAFDSADLSEQMRRDLDTIAEHLDHAAPGAAVQVTGHTDSAGDPGYNQHLSQRRAEAAAQYLREQLDQDSPRIDTGGAGEDDPRAGVDAAGQRRVEITYTLTAATDPQAPPPSSTPAPSPEDDPGDEESEAPDEPGAPEEEDSAAEHAEQQEEEPEEADEADEAEEADSGDDTGAAAPDAEADGDTAEEDPAGLPPAAAALALAAATAAALAAGAMYRRRRLTREPSPDAPHEEDEAAESEPEPSSEASAEHHAHIPRGFPPAADADENADPDGADGAPPASGTGIDARIVVELLRAPGIGTVGSGAPGAARALLATALHTDPQAPAVRIILPAPDAEALLGAHGRDLLNQKDVPTIEVAESLPDALMALHVEAIERQHTLADADCETTADYRAAHPGDHSLPPLILIATPDPLHDRELADLLASGSDLAITAVLLGSWPSGGTVTIERGTVIDASNALTLLRGAHWPAATQQTVTALLDALPAAQAPHAAPAQPDEPEPAQTASASRGSGPGEGDADAAAQAPAQDEGDAYPAPPPPPTPEPAQPIAKAEAQPPASPGRESGTADPDRAPVQLRVLGGVDIMMNGSSIPLPRHTAYELAAYLAVHPDGVRLERAMADMWPEAEPRQAAKRFHDAASVLRSAIPKDAHLPKLVIHNRKAYQLNPDVADVDYWTLTDALQAAEHAPADQAEQALHQAVRLYTGEIAAGAYSWADPIQARLTRRLIDALRRGARQAAEAGRAEQAHAWLRRAIDLDPTREETHHQLIRLHAAQGDTTAARTSYRHYTQAMHHIDAAPTRRLEELVGKTT